MTERVLTTARLTLKPLASASADEFFPIFSDKRAFRYWHTLPHRDLSETASMISSSGNNPHAPVWAVYTREPVGAIGVIWVIGAAVPGVGYLIHPDYWRQGYGSEATAAVIEDCFTTLGFNRIELWIDAANEASQALANKLGFQARSKFYQRFSHEIAPHETLVFGLRADEWAAKYKGVATIAQREVALYGIHPTLPVKDVGATMRFYQERLGFEVIYSEGYPPTFAIVWRGEWTFEGAQLHIVHSNEPTPPGSLYIPIGIGVDRLHDEFRAKGVTIVSGLNTKPYGRREFTIVDNNGWQLRFSSAV